MIYREHFSLSNDCTDIEYWKMIKHVSMLTPTLSQRALFTRNKKHISTLVEQDLNRSDTKTLKSSAVKSISIKSALSNNITYRG